MEACRERPQVWAGREMRVEACGGGGEVASMRLNVAPSWWGSRRQVHLGLSLGVHLCGLTKYRRLSRWKAHPLIIPQFLRVRSLGQVFCSVSTDSNQGVRWAGWSQFLVVAGRRLLWS